MKRKHKGRADIWIRVIALIATLATIGAVAYVQFSGTDSKLEEAVTNLESGITTPSDSGTEPAPSDDAESSACAVRHQHFRSGEESTRKFSETSCATQISLIENQDPASLTKHEPSGIWHRVRAVFFILYAQKSFLSAQTQQARKGADQKQEKPEEEHQHGPAKQGKQKDLVSRKRTLLDEAENQVESHQEAGQPSAADADLSHAQTNDGAPRSSVFSFHLLRLLQY